MARLCNNFVGLVKEQKEQLASWNKREIEEKLERIIWRFNPTAAPLLCGMWEHLVKSCKRATFAILEGRSKTDKILTQQFV